MKMMKNDGRTNGGKAGQLGVENVSNGLSLGHDESGGIEGTARNRSVIGAGAGLRRSADEAFSRITTEYRYNDRYAKTTKDTANQERDDDRWICDDGGKRVCTMYTTTSETKVPHRVISRGNVVWRWADGERAVDIWMPGNDRADRL